MPCFTLLFLLFDITRYIGVREREEKTWVIVSVEGKVESWEFVRVSAMCMPIRSAFHCTSLSVVLRGRRNWFWNYWQLNYRTQVNQMNKSWYGGEFSFRATKIHQIWCWAHSIRQNKRDCVPPKCAHICHFRCPQFHVTNLVIIILEVAGIWEIDNCCDCWDAADSATGFGIFPPWNPPWRAADVTEVGEVHASLFYSSGRTNE